MMMMCEAAGNTNAIDNDNSLNPILPSSFEPGENTAVLGRDTKDFHWSELEGNRRFRELILQEASHYSAALFEKSAKSSIILKVYLEIWHWLCQV